jgi:peptidoglycan/LPS O-acetylase OafA/YrhL
MRNSYVDRLRGLAALMVVLSHASGYIPLFLVGLPTPIRYAISANGYNGVSIFFTISGFLITNKILAACDLSGRFSIGFFYLQRIARIAPCLVLMVSAGCFVAVIGGDKFAVDWHNMPARLWYIFTFRYNVYITSLPGAPRLWDPLWSLSVEEVFYLGFPALLLLVRNRGILIAGLVAIIIIAPIWRASTGNPYAYLSCFDEIAMGALAALGLAAANDWRPNAAWLRFLRYVGVAIIAANFLSTRSVYGGPYASLTWGPTLMGIGAATYLLGTKRADAPPSFAFFLLEKSGELSYEIYLSHMFLLIGLAGLFQLPLPTADNGLHKMLGTLWPLAIVAILLVGSYLIFRFYSEPANRLIRRLRWTWRSVDPMVEKHPPARLKILSYDDPR